MKREVFLSLLLHLFLVALTLFASPFGSPKVFDYDEVIRVKAVSLPSFAAPSQPAQPVSVPQPLADLAPDIPIDDPTTMTKTYPETKKPTPKPPKKPVPKPADSKTADTAGGSGSANGQKEIDVSATGAGSPFGGATIDNASFDYPYWFTQAFNKIAANWRQTVVADGTLVCVVSFQVIRSGRVLEIKIEKSSGIPTFDETCTLAIERAAPLPPLPREFVDEIIGITLPFKFEPR